MREREVTDLVYEEPPTPAPKDDPKGLWVARDYQVNPDLEEILVSGRLVEEGMLVLVEPHSYRTDIRALETATDDDAEGTVMNVFGPPPRAVVIEHLNRQNRWCFVTQLQKNETEIAFVGIYHDGTQAVRYYPIDAPWLVRRQETWMGGYTPKHRR